MARCEDFPCCEHELGCCPDYRNGVQLNMKCICGAVLPIDNPSSICEACLRSDDEEYIPLDDFDEEFDDSMDGDHASGLASAGYGTDEDYEHNLYDDFFEGNGDF